MEILEIIIILGILIAQGYIAFLAWNQIECISTFLNSEDNLELRKTLVDVKETETEDLTDAKYLGEISQHCRKYEYFSMHVDSMLSVGDIISVREDGKEISKAKVLRISYEGMYVETVNAHVDAIISLDIDIPSGSFLYNLGSVSAYKYVSLINVKDEENSPILKDVVNTINNYLKKNKGGAADFHLIKDIVERHTDSIDEEINHKLPVPIYLGLMGTVIGIIVGLFSLNFQFDPQTNSLNGELFVNSVSGLISGVKLAMICSCIGLLLTTLLSSWRYMGAKSKLEAQKNAFYDFVQTRLLPQMTKDAASTILALQSNLEKFNTSFAKNIKGFGNIMDDIHSTFDSQVKLQKELKKMDLNQVANLNVNVLSQLRRSMTEFEKFTQYLTQMNTFVRSTARLTDSINDQLQRTEAVETVVAAMQDNIQKNQFVMEKLREFLERINEKAAVTTAAGEIDSTMTHALEELKSHTQEQINSIRTYTTEATEDLHDLVTSERKHLISLDKLGKLDELSKLVSAINTMKDDNRNVNATLEKKIESLAQAVVDNTNAQRGESGISSSFKFLCMFLFVITCIFILIVAIMYISNNVDIARQQDHSAMYESVIGTDTEMQDTVAMDTVIQ